MYWYLKEVMPVFTLIAVLSGFAGKAAAGTDIFFAKAAFLDCRWRQQAFFYMASSAGIGAAGLWESHRQVDQRQPVACSFRCADFICPVQPSLL